MFFALLRLVPMVPFVLVPSVPSNLSDKCSAEGERKHDQKGSGQHAEEFVTEMGKKCTCNLQIRKMGTLNLQK